MNLLFSCIGKRGYIADFFRPHLSEGDRIIGTSNTKWTSGFEHCDFNYILPDINHPDYISRVKDVCQKESINAILSFFDPDVVELARHFDEFLAMGIQPVLPRAEIAEVCFDKFKTYKFLIENGFSTAKTYLEFEEVADLITDGSLSFPLYVKPRCGFGSSLTFKARKMLELKTFFYYAPDMIIQEMLKGEQINFDILNDLSGNVLSVVSWKKIRAQMGETIQSQTFYKDEVTEIGIKLGTKLSHYGPADADLFFDKGIISVLDINLRFGGGYPVSNLAGANYPAKIVSMIKGEIVKPDIGNYCIDTVMLKDYRILGGIKNKIFNKECWKSLI